VSISGSRFLLDPLLASFLLPRNTNPAHLLSPAPTYLWHAALILDRRPRLRCMYWMCVHGCQAMNAAGRAMNRSETVQFMRLEGVAGTVSCPLHLGIAEMVHRRVRPISPYEPYSLLESSEIPFSRQEISTSNTDSGAVLPIQQQMRRA
jgi:hypothetical protein